jgi:hypothetical protein
MSDDDLKAWLLKHAKKRVSYTFLHKALNDILQPIAASLKAQRDELAALKATNHGVQVRCDLLETRILELEAGEAGRGERVSQ